MKFSSWTVILAVSSIASCAFTSNYSTCGIEALVRRRLPEHVDCFSFALSHSASQASGSLPALDEYTVSDGNDGKIHISGNSPIALASGLRWYLTNIVHVDIYWFIGSQLHQAPAQLPPVNSTYHGASTVPWRYHFNTVTFSYTSAFWDWDGWELQLDWMALRGINLPLAWVGYEKILIDVFREAGFTDSDINSFLSGPAFQAWNRFGNIQGSWGGDLPTNWVDNQFELNKKIVARMVELGMTPVLPCFTGFVPMQIGDIYPNASFVNGSQWNGFAREYTNVTFLEPFDPLFAKLQKGFLSKQTAAYGDVTDVYTLDQYNENNPYSGDLDYLRNVTSNTIQSLKAADPDAIWLLQGWLFYSSEDFWTNDRVEAYLSGVKDSDMLILDLFSESQPQWQRTSSYFGKPWIWCELHDYGENMGLYGQVENVTISPIQALSNSSTMVGMGLTMEGQEGNEIMYDILLDQAWSKIPIDSSAYFHDWVTSRYHSSHSLPSGLYTAWDKMRQTVYNNTDLSLAQAVTKSILELAPNTTGLLNRTGHHPTTITYDPAILVDAWRDSYQASAEDPTLWQNDAYTFDLTDITRQVLANAFNPLYETFINAANHTSPSYSNQTAHTAGQSMIHLLTTLSNLLTSSAHAHFSLSSWLTSARNSAPSPSEEDFFEYSARNQITLWGPTGEISDYASKQWGGLVEGYYLPRWERFVEVTMNGRTEGNGENGGLERSLREFEEAWQETGGQRHGWEDGGWKGHHKDHGWKDGGWGGGRHGPWGWPQRRTTLQETIEKAVHEWPNVFGNVS